MGSEYEWGLGEGSDFQSDSLKIVFYGIFKQKEQFDSNFS